MPVLSAKLLLIGLLIAVARARPASVDDTLLSPGEEQPSADKANVRLLTVERVETREHIIKEVLYDRHIHIGDPTMFLPRHACDYTMCESGKVCVVKPGYKRHNRKLACKPHCIPLAGAIRKPHTTRECKYTPHPTVAGVEQLTCNCRQTCRQEASHRRVCGSDGNTYPSYCHLQRTNCVLKRSVTPVSIGKCPDTPEVEQRRLCTPSLQAYSVNRASPMYQPPVQYSFSFLLLACQARACPGAGPPVWFKQNVTEGVPGERLPYSFDPTSSIVHSRPGSAYNVIFPSRSTDSGLYTCEIHTGEKVFSAAKQVIVQRPTSAADQEIRRMEFEARLMNSFQR